MSNKIELDKYYTDELIVDTCLNSLKKLQLKYTDVIEPSAGNGAFSLRIPNCLAYDIEPEHESIVKQDFLKLNLPYKKGRLIIGNPPFGSRNSLSVKFFNHSLSMCDYIAFIQPISQYKNNQQMYQFNLIHSEELPLIEYSGRKLLCCFNVYERPIDGINTSKTSYKLDDVIVSEYRRGGSYKIPGHFDFAMNTYGSSLGREVLEIGTFCQENYIVINNENFREDVLDVMRNTDWKSLYPCISTPKIQTWKICKYLKESIVGLK